MDISRQSNEMLLFNYSTLCKEIDILYMQKKDLEKEIAKRNDILRERYQKGLINPERDDI